MGKASHFLRQKYLHLKNAFSEENFDDLRLIEISQYCCLTRFSTPEANHSPARLTAHSGTQTSTQTLHRKTHQGISGLILSAWDRWNMFILRPFSLLSQSHATKPKGKAYFMRGAINAHITECSLWHIQRLQPYSIQRKIRNLIGDL